MITKDANKNRVLENKARLKKEKEKELWLKCEAVAIERYGDINKLNEVSNANKGVWYLPALDENEQVEKLLILRPIDRHILSEASTKLSEGGLYEFLESAMRECIIPEHSDMEMMDEEDYFISAANSFNKIMEGKKTALLKR